MVQHGWLTAALFLMAPIIGCGPGPASPSSPSPPSWATKDAPPEHGAVAYDKTVLNIDPVQTLVVPEKAILERGGSKGHVEVFLLRSTSNATSLPYKDSDADDRKILTTVGCLRRTEKDKLIISAYGANAGTEFATTVHFLIRVSDDQPVETRPGQDGWEWPNKQKAEAAGWEVVATEPDPAQTAHRPK
jgi:hypothetical protein